MMDLSDHNEGKISVLDALDELEEADSFQVWEHLDEDVSIKAIQMALSRYYKMGLVGRTRKPDRVYFLTEKGFERLEFLLDSE
jgi:DNA-binding MarR family transcriptional regulator